VFLGETIYTYSVIAIHLFNRVVVGDLNGAVGLECEEVLVIYGEEIFFGQQKDRDHFLVKLIGDDAAEARMGSVLRLMMAAGAVLLRMASVRMALAVHG